MKLTFEQDFLKDLWYYFLRINLFEKAYEDMKMQIAFI